MNAQAILISVNETAELLSITRWRLLRLVRERRIPFIDLGDKEPRFSPDELRAWVQQRGAKEPKDAK